MLVCSLAHVFTLLYNYDVYLFQKRLTTEFFAALLLSRPSLIHVASRKECIDVQKNLCTKSICRINNFISFRCSNATEMTIEVNGNNPIVYRPHRLSHKEILKVREMVSDMLIAGIILRIGFRVFPLFWFTRRLASPECAFIIGC